MDYITTHRSEWEELERLTVKAKKRVGRLIPAEIDRLDVLYRTVSIQLAQVATRTTDFRMVTYLNSLIASAHSVIYLPQKEPLFKQIFRFFLDGFALTVCRQWRCHLLSFALLLMGFFVAYIAAKQDPLAVYALQPAQEIRLPGSSREQLVNSLRSGRDDGNGKKFFFSTFLFSNNLKVGLLGMAAGALAAVPTCLLIIYNGMLLGAFTFTHHAQGIYLEYWAWILPHGITELGAIVICGGIGLRLGQAVICPGRITMHESFILAGREAMRTILGVGGMLCLAAIIESFLRQSHLPTWARLLFAGGTAFFWIFYFVRGCRVMKRQAIEDALICNENTLG